MELVSRACLEKEMTLMKDRTLLMTLGLGLGLILGLFWILGGENVPVAAAPLAPESGDWDAMRLSAPMVVSDTGGYHLWYNGRRLSFAGWGYAVGYAASTDGLSWGKYEDNPVLGPGEPGEWDGAYRGQVAVLKDDGLYKMWYSAASYTHPWQTGYATSSDGLEWDIYAGNPVLEAGAPGSWDETESDGPSVIKDGATYKMWYHGCNADYTVCSIGYATSPDGVHWTKYAGNPVLEATPGQWDESGLGWPRVIKNGDAYQMWYSSDGQIGLATSPDGMAWTKHANSPVLSEGWDGVGIGPPALLLDGDTYKMWFSSGSDESYGLGYAESADGINWTQPVSNPILLPGEAGVIVQANYSGDRIKARTLGNTSLTITVSDQEGAKATISGVTDQWGNYYSWEHWEDWNPEQPDIVPGDSVSATANGTSTIIETVGEIEYVVDSDTEVVEGTIYAPWFAPESLTVMGEVWNGGSPPCLDQGVPADGGRFGCDFSGLADIVGGRSGQVGYLEPDGDMVSVDFTGSYMEVYYGTRDGVGGGYGPGHAFWITVTNPAGEIEATVQVTSASEGSGFWWGGDGFCPPWVWGENGEWGDWHPAEPKIEPGDWVNFQSDTGYEHQVRAGGIYGTVDPDNDSVTGPIVAPWLTETLDVWCYPKGFNGPPLWRQSSAEPDGSVPYFCEWQNPVGGLEAWDIRPEDELVVSYREPDGDVVYRTMLASQGAPRGVIYLPLVVRSCDQGR
jgi:predicted GH43/DUF377 family glycosyl hydrolase